MGQTLTDYTNQSTHFAMNRFLFFICATAAMFALCACSSDDDFPSNEELDKLPTVENLDVTDFLVSALPESYDNEDCKIELNKDYLEVFHSAEQLKEKMLNIYGRRVDETDRKQAELSEYFKYVDWNKQSVMLYQYAYPDGGVPELTSHNIYINNNRFIVSLNRNNDNGLVVPTVIVRIGYGIVIDKPDLSLKDISLKFTDISDRGENAPGDRYKVTERWVKR